MSFLDSLGVPTGFFQGLSTGNLVFWVIVIVLFFLFLIIAGGITFFYKYKKLLKSQYKNQIPLFQTVNGKNYRVGLDFAKEIYVPDSNISLFYLKGYKIFMARPTRAMGKNEFWYTITPNGEWVNFDLSMDPKHNTMATTNYDHRDTRYAYVNVKEIVKRNYKDKNTVWWKDPVIMNIISFVIMALVFVGACWFLIAKMGGLIEKVGQMISEIKPIAQALTDAVKNAQNINSGVVQA